MAGDKKISELPTVGTPARTDLLTALDTSGANVQGPASDYLALTQDSDLTFTDITTGNVSSASHGFAPKSPADATQFLNGAGFPAYAAVKDSDLALTDITTNDVSASKHGFAPKGAKSVMQVVNTETGAVATGTTTIPFDDTIPQITEGTQFLSLAITPTSATNKLRIDVVLNVSSSAAGRFKIMALFQDSTANALAMAEIYDASNGELLPLVLAYYMTAGTTAPTTFTVRAGLDQVGTITVNGQGGARKFGGVLLSSITITEYTP